MEEPTSPSIIENIRIESTLDYTVNICELTNASKGELFHYRKVSAPIFFQNILSLLHLPTIKTRNKKLLIDYSQFPCYF